MTHVDVGVTGAKRQSFDRTNPRDLLIRVIEENPGAGEAGWLRLFNDAVDNHEDSGAYDKVMRGYWFANNVRSLSPVRKLSPQKRRARAMARTTAVAAIKERIISISLDFIMPNGKALRDNTGKDCAQVGGLCAKLVKRVKPNEKVGSVLSEAQLQKLFKEK